MFNKYKTAILPQIKLQGLSLLWSSHGKYLGITLDSSFTFGAHIKAIISKCTRVKGMLYQL